MAGAVAQQAGEGNRGGSAAQRECSVYEHGDLLYGFGPGSAVLEPRPATRKRSGQSCVPFPAGGNRLRRYCGAFRELVLRASPQPSRACSRSSDRDSDEGFRKCLATILIIVLLLPAVWARGHPGRTAAAGVTTQAVRLLCSTSSSWSSPCWTILGCRARAFLPGTYADDRMKKNSSKTSCRILRAFIARHSTWCATGASAMPRGCRFWAPGSAKSASRTAKDERATAAARRLTRARKWSGAAAARARRH